MSILTSSTSWLALRCTTGAEAKLKRAAAKAGKAKTLNGSDVALARAGAFVTVDEAMVTQADVIATNGVVHVIDRVLTPPAAK